MISYFKYTTGNEFTLNGSPYSGFFNVLSGVAYTGRKKDTTSQELTPQNKFATKIYLNRDEFDTTYGDTIVLNDVNYINSFDNLDKPKFDKIISEIDSNNLYCFKKLIFGHPTIFNFDKNGYHYYAFSTDTPSETVPRFSSYPVETSYPLTGEWNFLNNLKAGAFTVDTNDNFKYFCADQNYFYILSGNFSNDYDLTKIYTKQNTPSYNSIHNIYIDSEKRELFLVLNDSIEIYDISNFDICQNMLLTNKIMLDETQTTYLTTDSSSVTLDSLNVEPTNNYHTVNPNNPEYVKIGNYFRTHLNTTTKILEFKQKYSSKTEALVELIKYVNGIFDVAIRSTDDYTIVLGIKNGVVYAVMIDPYDVENVKVHELKDLDASQRFLKVSFSSDNSNVFYVGNTEIYQARFISNPSNSPWGKLEKFIYNISGYSEKYENTNNSSAGETTVSINLFNTGNADTCELVFPQNRYTIPLMCINIPESSIATGNKTLSAYNNGEGSGTFYYGSLPLSALSLIDGKYYFFFTNYYWNFGDGTGSGNLNRPSSYVMLSDVHTYPEYTTYVATLTLMNGCDKTLAWDVLSVTVESISPEDLTATSNTNPFGRGPFEYNLFVREHSNYGNQYMLVCAYNRLLALKQPINDQYLNEDSLNVDKEFQYTNCSESSFGLYFNNNIHTVLKDTLTLYNNFETSFILKPDGFERKYLEYVPNIDEDLYLNTNETINVVPINRIMGNMVKMQQALLPENE